MGIYLISNNLGIVISCLNGGETPHLFILGKLFKVSKVYSISCEYEVELGDLQFS